MTTPRRAARAGAGITAGAIVDGVRVPLPVELTDPDNALWADSGKYRAWMTTREWAMGPADRIGVTTHPHNRHATALIAWARQHRVCLLDDTGDHVNLHKLRTQIVLTQKDSR